MLACNDGAVWCGLSLCYVKLLWSDVLSYLEGPTNPTNPTHPAIPLNLVNVIEQVPLQLTLPRRSQLTESRSEAIIGGLEHVGEVILQDCPELFRVCVCVCVSVCVCVCVSVRVCVSAHTL
jgi:hypothetical protein